MQETICQAIHAKRKLTVHQKTPTKTLIREVEPYALYRALFKAEMRQAGLLEHIAPQVWTIPWNVHSQANHHGHSAFTSLAPRSSRSPPPTTVSSA